MTGKDTAAAVRAAKAAPSATHRAAKADEGKAKLASTPPRP